MFSVGNYDVFPILPNKGIITTGLSYTDLFSRAPSK
jgi:hypothetical protein